MMPPLLLYSPMVSWKFTYRGCGAQCVVMVLVRLKLVLPAANWDSMAFYQLLMLVRLGKDIISHCSDFTSCFVDCFPLRFPFSRASMPTEIWLDVVSCSNGAQSLLNCTHSDIGLNNCDHNQDVLLPCNTGMVCMST